MIQYQRHCRQSYSMLLHAKFQVSNLHDFNCGLKAYRKDVVKNIEVYGEMHRYIPYLAKNAGFQKIGEKVVHHQARKYGTTKFDSTALFNGYLDLISLGSFQVRNQAHAFSVC